MKKPVRKKGMKLRKASDLLHSHKSLKDRYLWDDKQRMLLRKAIGDFIREKGWGEYKDGVKEMLAFADKDFKKARKSMSLAGMLGIEGVVEPLALVLKMEVSYDHSKIAINALGNIGDKRAIKPLLERTQKDQFFDLRKLSAEILGEHFAAQMVESRADKARVKVAIRKFRSLDKDKRGLLLYLIATTPKVRRNIPTTLNAKGEKMAFLLGLKKDAEERSSEELFHTIEELHGTIKKMAKRRQQKKKAKKKKKGKK